MFPQYLEVIICLVNIAYSTIPELSVTLYFLILHIKMLVIYISVGIRFFQETLCREALFNLTFRSTDLFLVQ